jgi:hypothetical protein
MWCILEGYINRAPIPWIPVNSETLIYIFQRELAREGSLEWIYLYRVLATREIERV